MADVRFLQIGSSNNSAVDWDISSKFSVQIDLNIAKRVPPLKLKLELHEDFPFYGRHLDKIDVTSQWQ